jgi:hypothetical protein
LPGMIFTFITQSLVNRLAIQLSSWLSARDK